MLKLTLALEFVCLSIGFSISSLGSCGHSLQSSSGGSWCVHPHKFSILSLLRVVMGHSETVLVLVAVVSEHLYELTAI